MKAIVNPKYGPPDVLQYTDVANPTPTDDEILVRIYAAALNPLDKFVMRGMPLLRSIPGMRTPTKGLGADLAGRVAAVGKNVKRFQPGDEVFGGKFGGKGLGTFAEYVCTLGKHLTLKPANLSFEEATAVPVAAITALQALRDKGKIQPGQKVVVDSASGGVGTFTLQIAKTFGAEVTAVCSTRNVDVARSLGADHVIDYSQEDFTKNGEHYDLIIAANAHHSLFDYRRVLRPDGILVVVGGGVGRILQAVLLGPLLSRIGRKKVRFFIANINPEDLVLLKDLLEAGKIVPVIDRRYPLSDVAEAVRYLEEGHAQGKIVITIAHSNDA
jgi:NADPH:quinone reductase-like Zn-dependent oxidoreductase